MQAAVLTAQGWLGACVSFVAHSSRMNNAKSDRTARNSSAPPH